MDDRFNTIAGWVLFAGIIGLGFNILSGKYFHAGDPPDLETEKMGFVIEGVEEEGAGGPAEMTMAEAVNMAETTASAGEGVYAKCSSCHTITPGGANGIGPNLHGIMGAPIAAKPGFAYSSALTDLSGEVWTWDNMNAWLANPKSFAPGTKMSFAGLSKIEDRASVSLFMNMAGSNIALPEYVAEVAGEGEEAEAGGEEAGEVAEAEAEQNAGEEVAEAAE